jgi:hypothetical protein
MRRALLIGAVVASGSIACVIDRPIADEATDRSPTTKLFAVDCRAWLTDSGDVEAQIALVDFAEAGGDLRIRWSVDGVQQPSVQKMRPRIVREGGRFLKYSLQESFVQRLPAGEHRIAVTVENLSRSAACSATITAP